PAWAVRRSRGSSPATCSPNPAQTATRCCTGCETVRPSSARSAVAMTEIVVLGAGPAGAAVALGLKRLGYAVRVVSEWRRFAAVEGVSQRVLDGLRQAGLQRALACAAAPSPRRVLWNGDGQSINQECLLDRPRFDAAIREDLREAGIETLEARVLKVESTA